MPALPPPPPAIQEPAPPTAAQTAEEGLLEAYDWGKPLPKAPNLQGTAALSYQWLRTALSFDPLGPPPRNPYPEGPKHQEIQALLALMKRPMGGFSQAVKVLPMKSSGTAIALWRWGQTQVQRSLFNAAQRRAWEDRLITTGLPLTRGYALRHALCWALAERDETRFTELRNMADATAEDIVTGFQRLFGLLGGPLPVLRLWSLPALEYQDQAFSSAHRIWIYPLEEGPLPDVPEGTLWIIPSEVGAQDARNASLETSTQQEGEALADRLSQAGRQAWFAPSRPALEQMGLVWFPALLEVDEKGNLTRICMGDAGPRQP